MNEHPTSEPLTPTPVEADERAPRVTKPQFRRAQVQLVHAQMRNEFLFDLCVIAAAYFVLWETVPVNWLAIWSVLAILSLGWRSLFIHEHYSAKDPERVNVWAGTYLHASFVSGAVWGSLSIMAFLYGNELHLLLIFMASVCVALAAYTSMQSSPSTFAAFAIPVLTPGIVLLATGGNLPHQVLATTVLLLLALLHASGQGFRTLLAKSIKLSSHNTELIHNLVAARESAESARQRLQAANEELQIQIEERRKAEDRIWESKERMQAIFEGMQDTLYQVGRDGTIRWATPSILPLLGYSSEEVVGRHARELFFSAEDHEQHNRALEQSFGRLQHYEVRLRRRDGSCVWVSENAVYRYDEMGRIIGHEATLRDITALKQTKEALFLAQEQAYVTLASIGDGVITVDMEGRVTYLNTVAERATGWTLEEAHGRALAEVFHIVDEKTLQPVPDPVQLCLQEGQTTMLPGYLLIIHRHLDQRVSIEVNTSPIRNSAEQISGVVLIFHDVSELRSLAQMTYHATHDSLTGLINRREFEKRVNQALENTRDKDLRFALCYLDLDNFKVVNDTCGHVAGDELLKQLSFRLRAELREGDTLSRIGGDEFGILLSGCSIAPARRLAEKLRKSIEELRFVWDDKSFRIGASIGLVPITAESGSLSDILSAADSACYVAKETGRNRIHVYATTDSALAEQQGQMVWVQRIQQVLDQDRFQLYFQPIEPIQQIPQEQGKLHGEVLVRMVDEDGSLIGPGAFIPAAERYSLMPAIDRWVVEHTLRTLAQDVDHAVGRLSACSINLSGQSLSDDRFLPCLLETIDATGVPPEILCFEITETAVISNLTNATRLIGTLRERGCRFALDDFGVGLSSFGYLKNLPVDFLKLDGCFIQNMSLDTTDHAMVWAINHIGQTMRIKTIAEFVETEETLRELRRIGVDYAQGFVFGQPLPLEEAVYGDRHEPAAERLA